MKKLTKKQSNRFSWAVDIFCLLVILVCLFFIQLGTRALFAPDEGRYAEIAREMALRGDYVTPYLNSIKYFEKPVMFYWLAAASIKIGGAKVIAVRAVNALLAILGSLLTYATTRLLYNRRTGLLAALILSTSLLYFVMAHMVSLDLPLTVFLAASFYAFILASTSTPGYRKRIFIYLAASMAACAVLTKGLIGIVFPILVIVPWLIITGEWRKLRHYYLPSAIIVFLLIAAPWHILVGWRNPGFFDFYFIEQHFLRYTTPDIGHYQPVWFFIPCLILGFFPWIVFLPQALVFQSRDKRNMFFVLWATLIFIFFSFSKSKLIPYILPIFPALAILTAHYLDQAWSHVKKPVRTGFAILFLISLSLPFLFNWFLHTTAVPDTHHASVLLNLAAFTLISGFLFSLIVNRQTDKAFIATLTATFLFLLLLQSSIPFIDTRSVQPLAAKIKPQLTSDADVITYDRYYQELPFYLERRISILNWQNELSYGMQDQDTSGWMINDRIFWNRWNSKQRVFVFMGQNDLQKFHASFPSAHFYVVAETLTNVVISNHTVQ